MGLIAKNLITRKYVMIFMIKSHKKWFLFFSSKKIVSYSVFVIPIYCLSYVICVKVCGEKKVFKEC